MKVQSNPPIDFDLRQLEIFKQVVEMESFSKAAQKVFLAQASVSERIANLENSVGIKLLDRLGRRVVPTKAGELLYKHAILLLEMKTAACLEIQDFLGLKSGYIHIGGSTIPGEYILPRVIGKFRKQYPKVSISLTVGSTSQIESLVLDGNFELGVIGSPSTNVSLICQELWQDELVVAVHPMHRWASKKEILLDQLYEEPFIQRETGSGTLKIYETYLLSAGAGGIEDLKVVACFGTSTAVKEGVKAGLGISIISSRAIETEIKTGLLKAVKIHDLHMSRSFYLIRDKRKVASPLCRALFDFLMSCSNE